MRMNEKFQAHVYRENKSRCSAFLANIDERDSATVTFLGQVYTLPPWSVSILPDCRKTVFNTAKVGLCFLICRRILLIKKQHV